MMIRDNWWVALKIDQAYDRLTSPVTYWVRLVDVKRVTVEQVDGGGNTWRVIAHVMFGDATSVKPLLYSDGIFDRQIADGDAHALLTACAKAASRAAAAASDPD